MPEENMADIQEGERRRLAREIHDWMNQYLVDIYRQVRAIVAPQCAPAVERISGLLLEANGDLRRIMDDLHPHLLEDVGLGAACSSLVGDFRERTGIQCSLSFDLDEAGLGPRQSLAVFRILQEALTNVRRHARAQSARVSIVDDGANVSLRIVDDGVGFGPEGNPNGRLGLLSMRERAASLGGRLVVNSTLSRGTVVEGQIPK